MPVTAELDDELDRVLAEIAGRDDCRLLPPTGQARVPDGLAIPDELRRFHDRCGGADLFTHGPFRWHVSGPDRLVPASPRLLTPAIAARVTVEHPDDLTNTCYVIADGGDESATARTSRSTCIPTGWAAAMTRSGTPTAWSERCPSSP